ncbi:MocR-like transcription factor YczR [Phytomonospora endophytica]|uniref:DNA-binding transcriptional MocR family regulator n=1 Tax=Phytomonospora endophytica TaxID=714109 RepID=A0A841FMI1_9ACTN|nr:PLP-dependent aminotransferase family protein [Phytomonospora endophytica]MBB6033819.1 DNA-binding transcriptional MocR family regulator [Phytomonospora endophytica]
MAGVGARRLAGMLPSPAGPGPVYRHWAEAIGGLVLDGRIGLHVRLPAERELAAALGTSRTTVTAVYDLLRANGFARSRRGAGTWTALPEGRSARVARRLLGPDEVAIDLARAAPGLPEPLLAEALAEVGPRLAERARSAGYHPFGLPELRAAVAERFTRRGLATTPEQVLVTSGAQHGLSLVLGLLCGPGDRVLVENPTYPNALEAMRRARLRPVPVPVTDAGWDVEIVESTLRQVVPRLAYLIPDFQNPTGRLMPTEERLRVLRAAAGAGTWLVIDEAMAELALDVEAPAPTASLAGGAKVVTVGSMSKTHWGGLRIGWVRASARLVSELAAQRVAVDMGGSVLDQLLALVLLERGEGLLRERLAGFREGRAALTEALVEHLPGWSWRVPAGGLSLWVDLGEPVASVVADGALGRGVRIEGGGFFGVDPGVFERRLRIPYTLSPGVLREAVQRMAGVLADGGVASVVGRGHWIA